MNDSKLLKILKERKNRLEAEGLFSKDGKLAK